jgi:hypothetical protein
MSGDAGDGAAAWRTERVTGAAGWVRWLPRPSGRSRHLYTGGS